MTPNAKIEESLKILKEYIGLLATATSIPQDVLDATLTQSVSSAEAARIRAIPLVQRAKQLVPTWRANEQRLILAATALIEYHQTGGRPIDMRDIASRTESDIQISPQILPTSPNELTQDIIARISFGLMTPEDGVRMCSPSKSDDEVKAMADEIRSRANAAGKGQEHAQRVLQETASAPSRGQHP